MPRHFGFAHASRPAEQETADRLDRIAQPAARHADGCGQRLDGLVLAEDDRLQVAVEVLQRAAVVGGHRLYRHAGDLGDDLYIYTAGVDTIQDTGGLDTLRISAGKTINDIKFENFGTDDLKIILTAKSHEIILDGQRGADVAQKIEVITFDDGFTADLSGYANWIWGTTVTQNTNGTAGDDTIIARAGNDTVKGGIGNDLIHGGAGNDILYGENDADIIFGGLGGESGAGARPIELTELMRSTLLAVTVASPSPTTRARMSG